MVKRIVGNGILAVLLLAMILVWSAVVTHPQPKMSVNFLNVGQGDATYIKFPNGQDALIDGGPNNKVLTELGKVMPFYDKELDLVILTHDDSDHLAGLVEVLKNYKVKEIWVSGATAKTEIYAKWAELLKEKGVKPTFVKTGYDEKFGVVDVKVIYPLEDWAGKAPKDQHEADVVTRLVDGKVAVLMTGDLGVDQESQIVASGQIIQAEILKVPHHGSATGLAPEFLTAISPKVAVISLAKNNKYGFPSEKIMKLLTDGKVQIYRTDTDGKVSFEIDGQSFKKVN